MTAEDNKTLARRWIDEVINAHDLARGETLVSSDCVMHFSGLPEPLHGFAAMKELGAAYFAAFPDLHVTIGHELADDDMAAHIYTWTATHRGELQGIPATGKQVTVAGADAFRIKDGKIVEHWVFDDVMGLMQQIGAIPQPEQARA